MIGPPYYKLSVTETNENKMLTGSAFHSMSLLKSTGFMLLLVTLQITSKIWYKIENYQLYIQTERIRGLITMDGKVRIGRGKLWNKHILNKFYGL